MSDRVEVLPGPGTVLRYGHVAIWAGPSSSSALLTFLVHSARNVGESTLSGRQIVDHIAGILAMRDPEPGAPFAVIGRAGDAWLTLLHGPVQLWDGARWLAPTPQQTWLRSDVRPQPAVSIGPAGSASPRLSSESLYDLGAGTVPGGGLILLPDRGGPPQVFSAPAAQVEPHRPGGPPVPGGPPADPGRPRTPIVGPALGGRPSTPVPAGPSSPGAAGPPTPGPIPPGPPPPLPTVPPGGAGAVAADARGGSTAHWDRPPMARQWVQLTSVTIPPRPAVPFGGAVTPDGRPLVSGVRCERDHFNHPASRQCAWCGRPLTPGQPATTGPRPALGVLIAGDDGTTVRLDVDQVLGSNPSTDQGVAAGRLRGVILNGAADQLAPAHAELRLSDWTLNVIDRGSAVGTFVVHTGTTGWERLVPYHPVTLRPGSHLSLGQRVLTFVSPWPG